jgi:hypothetical protein
MSSILRLLCFFPSITFGLLTAEVLPYAMAYSALHAQRIKLMVYLFISLVLGSAIYSVLSVHHTPLAGEALRSSFAYLNPILIFAVILALPKQEYMKFVTLCQRVFIFLAILMLVQFSGLFGFLDPIFKIFVPRASSTALGFRGITLLSTEPARASVEFLFLYLVFRIFWLPARYKAIADIAVGVAILVVFKSATTVFLYGVYLALFNRTLLWLSVPVLIYLIVTNNSAITGRAFELIKTLNSLSFDEAVFHLVNTSGNRIISIFSAVEYGLKYPFGGGVGNWQETSVDALVLTGYDYTQLNYFNAEWKDGNLYFRATGYMMNLMMDLGIVGVGFATALIYSLARPFVKTLKNGKSIFTLFLLNVFFVGSVGAPVPWIATAILLRSRGLPETLSKINFRRLAGGNANG